MKNSTALEFIERVFTVNKIKLAIAGAGIISQQHLKAAIDVEAIELVAIADISKEKAEKAASDYGINAYTDYVEMMEVEKPDGIIIALPHFLHKEASIEAANRGIHILLEKPMANTIEECDEIINAAESNKVNLMIGHIVHFSETNIKIKEIIQSNELGNLIMIADTRFNNYFKPERPRWFLDKKQSGGGIVINLGAHSIDAIQYTTGYHVKSVLAKLTYPEEYTAIEGSGQIFLELENGVSAVINLNGYTSIPRDEKEYYFEKGILKVNSKGLFIAKKGQKEFEDMNIVRNKHKNMADQLEEFAHSILSGREPSITGQYGKSVIKAIMAAYKSNETGNKINLAELNSTL
jgi:predicted dehydrogenase